MNTYEVRFRIPHSDNEQYVYGFKFKTIVAADAAEAKAGLPPNSFDIHVTAVPSLKSQPSLGIKGAPYTQG